MSINNLFYANDYALNCGSINSETALVTEGAIIFGLSDVDLDGKIRYENTNGVALCNTKAVDNAYLTLRNGGFTPDKDGITIRATVGAQDPEILFPNISQFPHVGAVTNVLSVDPVSGAIKHATITEASENIGNTDLTLSANRILDCDNKTLSFDNAFDITFKNKFLFGEQVHVKLQRLDDTDKNGLGWLNSTGDYEAVIDQDSISSSDDFLIRATGVNAVSGSIGENIRCYNAGGARVTGPLDVTSLASAGSKTVTCDSNGLMMATEYNVFNITFGANITLVNQYFVSNGIATTTAVATSVASKYVVPDACELKYLTYSVSSAGAIVSILLNGVVQTTITLSALTGGSSIVGIPYSINDVLELQCTTLPVALNATINCVFRTL